MSYWDRHGEDLCLKLLNANFVGMKGIERAFVPRILEAVALIPDRDLEWWLLSGLWREMLTAAWIIGFKRQRRLFDKIREQLLAILNRVEKDTRLSSSSREKTLDSDQ
jgi:hypothetical protein